MDNLDTLVVEVRASTDGFAADIGKMRDSFDGILVEGFAKGGSTLEHSLASAIRKGSLGFEDLGKVASRVLDTIASQSLKAGLSSLGISSGMEDGVASGLTGVIGSLFGLPGRATGGPVAPGRPYVVGERGPEMFVPTSAGRIETGSNLGRERNVNVSIRVVTPAGSSSPESLRRSSRQVAQAVRRALAES